MFRLSRVIFRPYKEQTQSYLSVSRTLGFQALIQDTCILTTDILVKCYNTRVGTLIVATIYLQLIQNRYMFRSFTVLHCSHQHCAQPVATDVEVVGYL